MELKKQYKEAKERAKKLMLAGKVREYLLKLEEIGALQMRLAAQ